MPASYSIDLVGAASRLQTTALLYRLAYRRPAQLRGYRRTRWAAPPNKVLSMRLGARLAPSSRFIVGGHPADTNRYRVQLTLADFSQVFSSPDQSECVVTLVAAIIDHRGLVTARRAFSDQRPAPTADAAGAIEGLLDASDSVLDQMLAWLRFSAQADIADTMVQ
jgi:cholesterol transport system auxiliary component